MRYPETERPKSPNSFDDLLAQKVSGSTRFSAHDKRIVDRVARAACRKKLERVAKKKIVALTAKVAGMARCQRTSLDLEDAVVVLEMMVKNRRCFMKELKAVRLDYEKYPRLEGFD